VSEVIITTLKFKNFKALKDYTVFLKHLNILAGPNNSGKSTIISAFRVLAAALRVARQIRPYRLLSNDSGLISQINNGYGYAIKSEAIPISLENVHTDYDQADSVVQFQLSNGNELIIIFPKDGGCYLIPRIATGVVSSPKIFKKNFPVDIGVVPVLGPLEYEEEKVTDETIRRGLTTHRASRHFRNYWYLFPEGFEDFRSIILNTWDGVDIKLPELISGSTLMMFCSENRIDRELYWMGFGFQVWCQMLTHISRQRGATILLIDEPDIYLHPDLQRRLISILRELGPSIILATHSSEILSEAEPSDIVLVDKKHKRAARLNDMDGVQLALTTIGSLQNITLTQLARTRRVLYVEGDNDYKYIRKFAKCLGYEQLAAGINLTMLTSGGFSHWKKICVMSEGIREMLNQDLLIGAVFDRDYRCDEEIDAICKKLRESLQLSHIHRRKEIENYLLLPRILEKAVAKLLLERRQYNGGRLMEIEPIAEILERITNQLHSDIYGNYSGPRSDYIKSNNKGLDSSTISADTFRRFSSKWNDLESRLEIVPGKDVFKALTTELQENYGISLTPFRVIDQFRADDVPPDMKELIHSLEQFRKTTS
jgi:energy-coupling factor transporter ATP-binding protein EcfA2